MKKQISISETDLKMSYILFSLIPILTGLMFIILSFLDNDFAPKSFFIKFSVASCIIGLLLLVIVNRYVPYCYKIEVDDDMIYITKSETIILSAIEKTIVVDKDLLQNVSGSVLGLKFFFKRYHLYYLNFTVRTEYGSKIAFLSNSQLKASIPPYFRKYPK